MNKENIHFLKLLVFPTLLVLIIWIVEIIEETSGLRFTKFGIYPRDVSSLTGILTAPFIHSDWKHLISNSFPLFALSTIMVVFYKRLIVATYIGIILLTGISVWLFARESYHLGISGVVYGLIGFIFWAGLFRENTRSIILSLVILIAYSGYFQGLTPEEGVSWESHLFGAMSGAFLAFAFKNIEVDEEELFKEKTTNINIEISTKFFSPDTFLFTKEERELRDLLDEE